MMQGQKNIKKISTVLTR